MKSIYKWIYNLKLEPLLHMPPIVYENGLGPAACNELQIEVAFWWQLALTSRNLGKMVVNIWSTNLLKKSLDYRSVKSEFINTWS